MRPGWPPFPAPWAGLERGLLSSLLFVCIFHTCTQALPEPFPFSIFEPNSNKAVTKVPNPATVSSALAQGPGWTAPRRWQGTQAHRCIGLDLPLFPNPKNRLARGQVCFITKNLLSKQNRDFKWDRKEDLMGGQDPVPKEPVSE
jgi:hypothetical protein